MRQSSPAWHRARQLNPVRITALGAAGLLLAAAVVGSSSAAASPAAGYTASFIPLPSTGLKAASVAFDPVTDNVYIGEENTTNATGEVIAVNESSDATVATVPLAGFPTAIGVDSATDTIYVAYGASGTGRSLAVIDGATNSVSATIALPGGPIPLGIAVDGTTNTIYVTRVGSGVAIIDGSTNTVTATVSSGGINPYGIAVDEATNVIWVANESGPVNDNESGSVTAINGATGSVIDSVSVDFPIDVAVNPDTNTVYAVSGDGANPLTVIDGASGTITTTVPVTGSEFGGLAVDPSANVVFAQGETSPEGSGTVIIDGATNAIADVLDAHSAIFPAVNPATDTLYEVSAITDFSGPGVWAIAPSAANGISPVISGPASATASVGVFLQTFFDIYAGQPMPTITETGPLPAGVTLTEGGLLSGTPAAGTDGVYPITVTASNGVAPDFSLSFTLTVEQQQPYEVQASQQSGFCLDNTGGSNADGNPIQIWSCLGNASQGWLYVPSANGVAGDFQLENANGLCLDDPGDSAVNGTRVQLSACLGDASQQWTEVTADGSFTDYVNANGLCLDNTSNALTDGNRVQVWACNGGAAQHWYGPSPQSSTIPPLDEVQASQQSGVCLDDAGGSSANGTPIQIWDCLRNANQSWKYVPSVNGETGDFQLENSNGLCLDDPGDSAANGTKVQLWSCLGNPSQTWTQITINSIFTEYVNANGLCLDNTGNALLDGDRVQVWACTGDAAQQWFGPSPQSGI